MVEHRVCRHWSALIILDKVSGPFPFVFGLLTDTFHDRPPIS